MGCYSSHAVQRIISKHSVHRHIYYFAWGWHLKAMCQDVCTCRWWKLKERKEKKWCLVGRICKEKMNIWFSSLPEYCDKHSRAGTASKALRAQWDERPSMGLWAESDMKSTHTHAVYTKLKLTDTEILLLINKYMLPALFLFHPCTQTHLKKYKYGLQIGDFRLISVQINISEESCKQWRHT